MEKAFWPADSVERRPLADLVPYAGNARTHSEAQVAQIAESIRRFGFTVPVLVDPEGGIIAGHVRGALHGIGSLYVRGLLASRSREKCVLVRSQESAKPPSITILEA